MQDVGDERRAKLLDAADDNLWKMKASEVKVEDHIRRLREDQRRFDDGENHVVRLSVSEAVSSEFNSGSY